jgi:hypothetical protein
MRFNQAVTRGDDQQAKDLALQLQDVERREQNLSNMMSNMIRREHDTMNAIIRNM